MSWHIYSVPSLQSETVIKVKLEYFIAWGIKSYLRDQIKSVYWLLMQCELYGFALQITNFIILLHSNNLLYIFCTLFNQCDIETSVYRLRKSVYIYLYFIVFMYILHPVSTISTLLPFHNVYDHFHPIQWTEVLSFITALDS